MLLTSTKFKLPSWAAIGLAVLAGTLSVINVTSGTGIGLSSTAQTAIAFALAVLAALGISPLTGVALQTALKISHSASIALASVFSSADAVIVAVVHSESLKAILVAVVTIAAGVLFGPAVTVTQAQDAADTIGRARP